MGERRRVEMGMIETDAGTFACGPIALVGESADAYDLARDLIALDQVWCAMNKALSTLEDAFKAHNEARDAHDMAERAYDEAREKISRRGLVDMSESMEFMWKTILRMRAIRGVDAPILVPTSDLRAAIVDILRMEVQAFDAAIEQANDPNT